MRPARNVTALAGFFILPTWCGHTLTPGQEKILSSWLTQHVEYRFATDMDCECLQQIQYERSGSLGTKPIPDYHPYTATGDFNGDGREDFAVVLIDRRVQTDNFTLVVFNGGAAGGLAPAFIKSGLDLQGQGLSYGPPLPKPYRLVLGRFQSDFLVALVPRGRTYKIEEY